jgi:hypothetical protein
MPIVFLTLACLLWGLSFPLIKALHLEQAARLPEASTWFLAAWLQVARFGLAALLLIPLLARRGIPGRLEIHQGLIAWWDQTVDSEGESVAAQKLSKAFERMTEVGARLTGTPFNGVKDIVRIYDNATGNMNPIDRRDVMAHVLRNHNQLASLDGELTSGERTQTGTQAVGSAFRALRLHTLGQEPTQESVRLFQRAVNERQRLGQRVDRDAFTRLIVARYRRFEEMSQDERLDRRSQNLINDMLRERDMLLQALDEVYDRVVVETNNEE